MPSPLTSAYGRAQAERLRSLLVSMSIPEAAAALGISETRARSLATAVQRKHRRGGITPADRFPTLEERQARNLDLGAVLPALRGLAEVAHA